MPDLWIKRKRGSLRLTLIGHIRKFTYVEYTSDVNLCLA